jgi:hypothetical protein
MQPECEIWLDNQLSSALAKLMQAVNLPTKLLCNKYGKNFKLAIKLLQKTKTEIIFIE